MWKNQTKRPGFTLLELLMVIAIIGVLAGLTMVGIGAAKRAAAVGRMSTEVSQLSQAVENYKLKHGDYPPDFSNLAAVQRHFRKAFPKIQSSELLLLENAMYRYTSNPSAAASPPEGIDEAEALVFCLGGFSDNPQLPFTGTGGPLAIKSALVIDSGNDGVVNGTDASHIDNYQYNTDRNPGFYDFQARLTLVPNFVPVVSSDDIADASAASTYGVTPVWDFAKGNNNQSNFHTSYASEYDTSVTTDPFPVFQPKGSEMPYAYFNSQTYGSTTTAGYYFNYYEPRTAGTVDYKGVARPYKSSEMNTAALTGSAPTATDFAKRDSVRFYANKSSFQIICAGYDDHFGGVSGLVGTTPVNFIIDTGQAFHASSIPASPWPPTGNVKQLGIDSNGESFKYSSSSGADKAPNAQQDNLTNISAGEVINGINQ